MQVYSFGQMIISDISGVLILKMFVGDHIYELILSHFTEKKILHRFFFPFLGDNHFLFNKRVCDTYYFFRLVIVFSTLLRFREAATGGVL